jgi:DNA end-binding protein Ku
MHTLHHAAEIRSIDAVEELGSVPTKVKPEEIKLAKQVIETFSAPLDLSDYKDEYREGLQRIIDAKIAGEEIVAPTREAPPKVVNLMEALKRSLDTVSAAKKSPRKPPPPSLPPPRNNASVPDKSRAVQAVRHDCRSYLRV